MSNLLPKTTNETPTTIVTIPEENLASYSKQLNRILDPMIPACSQYPQISRQSFEAVKRLRGWANVSVCHLRVATIGAYTRSAKLSGMPNRERFYFMLLKHGMEENVKGCNQVAF